MDQANGKGWKQPKKPSAPEEKAEPVRETPVQKAEPVTVIHPVSEAAMNPPTRAEMPKEEQKPEMPKRSMPAKARVTTIVVDDPQFTVLSNGVCLAMCTVVNAGKQYKIWFDYLPGSVRESVKSKAPVDVVLYMHKGEIHCGGTPDMYAPVTA